MEVTYLERRMLDNYRCIDTPVTVNLNRRFEQGDLLYGYKDDFNVISIPKGMIVSPKFKDDKADFISAYTASYGETKKKAEDVYEKSNQSFIDLVIEGFKGNAKKAFSED